MQVSEAAGAKTGFVLLLGTGELPKQATATRVGLLTAPNVAECVTPAWWDISDH